MPKKLGGKGHNWGKWNAARKGKKKSGGKSALKKAIVGGLKKHSSSRKSKKSPDRQYVEPMFKKLKPNVIGGGGGWGY